MTGLVLYESDSEESHGDVNSMEMTISSAKKLVIRVKIEGSMKKWRRRIETGRLEVPTESLFPVIIVKAGKAGHILQECRGERWNNGTTGHVNDVFSNRRIRKHYKQH